ncbi:hypothetical protein AVEN_274668-1 [Araneus ventricosus]|uniref:Uncharacterized protein n=1 Tax=Araneus ventricosus TaxID=182803 RepID=A0A4Y2NNG1_ARAVE|nr:hypothetical protein AVEN_274668-1 [Araneus ventricosus]
MFLWMLTIAAVIRAFKRMTVVGHAGTTAIMWNHIDGLVAQLAEIDNSYLSHKIPNSQSMLFIYVGVCRRFRVSPPCSVSITYVRTRITAVITRMDPKLFTSNSI